MGDDAREKELALAVLFLLLVLLDRDEGESGPLAVAEATLDRFAEERFGEIDRLFLPFAPKGDEKLGVVTAKKKDEHQGLIAVQWFAIDLAHHRVERGVERVEFANEVLS